MTYADLRVRSLGAPVTGDRLRRVAAYRRRPDLVAGARVRAGDILGVVVDADSSANFIVECHDGRRVHVHPAELVVEASAEART